MRCVLLISFVLASMLCFADTLQVDINGMQDYTSIQAAVNDANDGDIVLVHPGTYYENIVIEDKFITLASLNYTTGDEQYIYSTILDGNYSGSVIRMELFTAPQPADVVIQGFTIIHGSGNISNTSWPEYGGGGISINCVNNEYWIDVYITNCQVKFNTADYSAGIGLGYWGNYHMKNVSVHHNSANLGTGGVQVYRSQFIHYPSAPCSYYANTGVPGHDVIINDVEFNTTIYADTLTCAEYDQGFIKVVPPSDSAPELTVYHEHAFLDVVDRDLYVSPCGNDNNSGLSWDDPLQSIWKAAYLIRSNPDSPRTIHLAPGLYSDEDGTQQFAIGLKDHVSLAGSGMDETLLKNSQSKFTIYLRNVEDVQITGMSLNSSFPVHQGNMIWSPCPILGCYIEDCVVEDIRVHDSQLGCLPAFQLWHNDRLTMDNVIIENNVSELDSGISLVAEDITITDCVIRNNRSVQYNHIYPAYSAFMWNIEGDCLIDRLIVMNNVNECDYEDHKPGYIIHGNGYPGSDLKITNSLFCDNVSQGEDCFLIRHYAGSIDFINCTFVGNQATERMINFQRRSETYECDPLQFTNCVLWNEAPYEVDNYSYYRCAIEVDHSLMRNGIDGIYSPYDEVIWGEGNLDEDPLLLGAEDFYYPMEGSPLINAGTPDTTGLCLPPHDIFHRARIWDGCIDIGCHEYGSVGVSPDPEPEDVPVPALALANYPNPFNPWTRITYSLPEASHVRLSVYNIRGQRVTTLVDEHLAAGNHSTVWDGRDERMSIVAGGVYLLRLQAGDRTEVRKVLMVK